MRVVLVWAAEYPSNLDVSILLQYVDQLRLYAEHIAIVCHKKNVSRLREDYFKSGNSRATVTLHFNPGWRLGFIRWVRLVLKKIGTHSFLVLPDIVHAGVGTAVQKVAAANHLPVVITRFSLLKPVARRRQFLRLAHRRLLLQAKVVQVDSLFLFERTKRLYPQLDQVLHTPIASVNRDKIDAVKAPPVAWDIAVVTPLNGEHGLDQLFMATKDINQCRILIIGDGSDQARLEKKVEEVGMKGRVQFTGWFPTINEVISSIKTCRMYVMNSQHLQSQLTLMQAMACMVPVVSMPTEFSKSLIQHGQNGRITNGSLPSLKQEIQWCLKHIEERVYLAEKAHHDVQAYAPATVRSQWQAFMRSVL